MDLTTTARLQDRLDIDSGDTAANTLLARLISRVSGLVENYLNRSVLSTSRTYQTDVARGQGEIFLPAYPVSSITSIKNDVLRQFDASTVIDSGDYYLESTSGRVSFDVVIVPGRGVLQVVYTGGMAEDTSSFITAYPDIAEAVDEQVAYHWMQRNRVGEVSQTTAGGSVSTVSLAALLPTVKGVLANHRRLAHA